jgi:hypothetical protein
MQGGLVPTTITVPTQPFFIFLTEQLRKKHDQLFKLRGPKKCNLTLQPCPFELAQLILQMCGAANSAHTVKLKQYHKLDPVFGQGWNRVEQEFKGQALRRGHISSAPGGSFMSEPGFLCLLTIWTYCITVNTEQCPEGLQIRNKLEEGSMPSSSNMQTVSGNFIKEL